MVSHSASNGKIIGVAAGLFVALVASLFMTSDAFRQKMDVMTYKIYSVFGKASDEAEDTQSRWDSLRGKKRRGEVRTLADDESSRGYDAVRNAAMSFVIARSKADHFPIYDEVQGRLLELTLDRQHEAVAEEAGVFVSCFDFRDDSGRLVDVDVLVVREGDQATATQARLHAVDGESRL